MATLTNSLALTYFKFLFFIGLYTCHFLVVDGGDTLQLGASLTGNQTLISRNGTFEMGFFSPSGTDKWYVGIWYAQSCDQKASQGVLLDSGNFVLLEADNISETVWESFHHPTDTWLPGMNFCRRHKYFSWKNSWDPSPGLFTVQLDPTGVNQIVILWNDSVERWVSGAWDGKIFSRQLVSQHSATSTVYLGDMSLIQSNSDTYVSYTVTPEGLKALTHFVLEKDRKITLYVMKNCEWVMIWSVPRDQCDVYGICGLYGMCDPNTIQLCSCIQVFKPRDNPAWDSHEWWSSGCVRRSPLQCSATNGTTDGFLQLSGMSLPDEHVVSLMEEQTPQGCHAACLSNYSCTAFTVTNTASTVCRFWFGDLLNIRNSYDGQYLFIQLAVSDLVQKPLSSRSRSRTHALIISIPVGAGVAIFLFLLALCAWRRLLQLYRKDGEDDATMFLRTFTYKELQIATRNFKHKLGSGGFGSVFKGTLPDNTLVAVKKLENTGQAEKQFRAEINTLGNMQHVNLVRLRGFCSKGARRLLVYDYMPNGSLNSFLFSRKVEKESILLDWKTRYRIALGTARALVYLHEECRDRIIHCDIKPANILLDDNFSPKVTNFGLAKLVGRDFSRVMTTTRGTRGYLAPEWISGGAITPNVDVYSFGMTLLEIIYGRQRLIPPML